MMAGEDVVPNLNPLEKKVEIVLFFKLSYFFGLRLKYFIYFMNGQYTQVTLLNQALSC